MRDQHFVVLIFFSLMSIIVTTIFSGVILSQNSKIRSNLENQQQSR